MGSREQHTYRKSLAAHNARQCMRRIVSRIKVGSCVISRGRCWVDQTRTWKCRPNTMEAEAFPLPLRTALTRRPLRDAPQGPEALIFNAPCETLWMQLTAHWDSELASAWLP